MQSLILRRLLFTRVKNIAAVFLTIAATETSLYSGLMVSLLFPDAEIKQYDTQEECLEAVANGKAGATVIPSSKINILNESPLTRSLSFAEMAKRQELGMFTTRETEEQLPLSIKQLSSPPIF
ncbi:MAG: hypothetical protein V8S76_01740 [Lachnospiraceae bacterium]